jgi:acetyltransferase-like isoleucine patch superfamily enzyme
VVRQRIADARRSARLAHQTARYLTPPPPSAFAEFGDGSWVVPPARVSMPEAIAIGAGVTIHEHAWLSVVRAVDGVEPSLKIGDRCSIGRLAHIACVGEIEIGDDVLTADRIFIADTYHLYENVERPVLEQATAYPKKVVIGAGAFLGIGCAVLQGVTVGTGAYVGAGAVVTRDVPPHTLVVGSPARPIRQFDAATATWRDVDDA